MFPYGHLKSLQLRSQDCVRSLRGGTGNGPVPSLNEGKEPYERG